MPIVRDDVVRARALVALHEALNAAEHDLATLLRAATITTAALLDGVAGICRCQQDGLQLAAFGYEGLDISDYLREVVGERCPDSSVLHAVVRDGEPILVGPDGVGELLLGLDERFQDPVREFSMTSMAAAPLLSRGECLGALVVARGEGSPVFDEDDLAFIQQIARVVALTVANALLLEDVERTRLQATALAREDQLTGLLNRRGFLEVLRETPLDRSALVAVFDMDGFRLVNDGFGHTVGDVVLASLAARLCASLPPLTPVARIGSDEFAALVQADDEEESADIIHDAVRECTGTFEVVGLSVPITISVGTAVPQAGGSDQVLQQADLAMSRAKRRGGFVAAYDPALDDPATRRLRDVLELRRAILGDGLVVHYQPVVPVTEGPPRVEALVRRKVGTSLALPGAWLDTANRSGLMPELTANVVRQVVGQLARWWEEGLEVECA
ncbi:MAG: diguanylate cyclase domain-containing protein, partial [Mycobacteriales bacterium]